MRWGIEAYKVAVLEFHKLLFAFVLVNRVVVCNDAFAVKSSLSLRGGF